MGRLALLLLLTLALLQHLCFVDGDGGRFLRLRETFNETFDRLYPIALASGKEDYKEFIPYQANEAVYKRGRGRPSKQLSVEEEEIRKKKKNERDRDDRAKKKKQQELFMEFCKEPGIAEKFKDFCAKKEDGASQHSDENLEMIQTVELKGATAVNSSSLGGGLMADACWNYIHALATLGLLLSTNKGTQIQMRDTTHDGEASTSSWAPPPHHELGVSVYGLGKMINAVTLGWNLMKKQLQSMPPGSEFLNLPLLDTIQCNPSLQNQFNEGLTSIGQGHPIDDKVAMQSDDPPVVVPRSFFSFHDWLENEVAREPNVLAPPGDAANIAVNGPQFQAANTRANNVEQEDDANDQEDG